MRVIRAILFELVAAVILLTGASSYGQVLINEFVIDERTAGSGQIHPSTREFVELYNSGGSAMDLSGWTLTTVQIGSNFETANGTNTYTIPNGASISAGGYYVIGHSGVTNVNFSPTPATPLGGDLFPDGNASNGSNGNFVFELRNSGTTLQDAVAVETFRGTERENITTEQAAFTGGGIWQQLISTNVFSPNTVASTARYLDGNTTNANGRDFGFLPETPGASNDLPQVSSHVVPDVDALAIETPLGDDYYASFILPRVITPTVADGLVNPNATAPLPAPLTGGNAVIAYDESGGGNAAFSKELVNSFDIYAYVDTAALGVTGSEATIYGIGTTDPFFSTPNSAGLTTGTSTANGSTGVGWLIQRANDGVETRTVVQLINFDDGGDSLPEDEEWDVIAEIEMTGEASAWHRLAIDYDPGTGMVTGRLDDDVSEFAYATGALEGDYNDDGSVDAADYAIWRKNDGTQGGYDTWVANFGSTGGGGGDVELFGTFYAGYRESLGAAFATSRPPTFVQYEAPPSAGSGSIAAPEPGTLMLVLLGMLAAAARRERS